MSQYDDDFWGNDDNDSTGAAETGGGEYGVVPKGTRCKAHIEDVEWAFYDPKTEENPDGLNIPYIKAKWAIELPSDYDGWTVPHALKINGENPKDEYYRADKQEKKIESAKNMIRAIDKNCGGKVFALRREPTNEELQRYLIGKPMYITLDVWEIGGKSGNWVRKIEPLNAGNSQQQSKSVQKRMETQKPQQKNASSNFDDMDDDIPFN